MTFLVVVLKSDDFFTAPYHSHPSSPYQLTFTQCSIFSRKKNDISFGCHPLDSVTPGGAPSDVSCVKLGYRDNSAPSIEDIFGDCDDQLFSRINTNSLHILQQYLPDHSSLNYSLRPRRHNKTLITKTTELNERDFIIRNIYKDIY